MKYFFVAHHHARFSQKFPTKFILFWKQSTLSGYSLNSTDWKRTKDDKTFFHLLNSNKAFYDVDGLLKYLNMKVNFLRGLSCRIFTLLWWQWLFSFQANFFRNSFQSFFNNATTSSFFVLESFESGDVFVLLLSSASDESSCDCGVEKTLISFCMNNSLGYLHFHNTTYVA